MKNKTIIKLVVSLLLVALILPMSLLSSRAYDGTWSNWSGVGGPYYAFDSGGDWDIGYLQMYNDNCNRPYSYILTGNLGASYANGGLIEWSWRLKSARYTQNIENVWIEDGQFNDVDVDYNTLNWWFVKTTQRQSIGSGQAKTQSIFSAFNVSSTGIYRFKVYPDHTGTSQAACKGEFARNFIYVNYFNKAEIDALRTSVNNTASLNPAHYTTASWNAFNSARNNALDHTNYWASLGSVNTAPSTTRTYIRYFQDVKNGFNNAYNALQTASYNLTFDANGGTGGTGPTSTLYNTAISAPAVSRTGYTFANWSPDAPSNMPAADSTYTAQWTLNSYNITWDANGGTGGGINSCSYGTAPTPLSAGTKANYHFTGWSPGLVAATGATTYTAMWAIDTYTITWDANGGTGGGSNSSEHGATPTPLAAGTRAGYNFTRWSPEIVAVTGAATYTAQWTASAVNITFDANGGTGGTGPTSMQPGAALLAPTVAREGYVFNGWNPTAPETVPSSAATYTAQWIKTEVTVTKLETGMKINIQGWTASTKYQIWTYQKVTSDTLMDVTSDVQANQWILSQAYTLGSAGDLDLVNGGINFTIDDFTSPNRNYTIAVRMADAGNNYLGEIRDSYTPEDVQEVVITKVIVDGKVSTGYEIKEIKSGAVVLIKVEGNNVTDIVYSAKLIGGQTEVDLPGNANQVWDISALEPGMYSIIFTATNGTTIDTQTISFRLYTLNPSVSYGNIDELTVTPESGAIGITPDYQDGTFSFRVREPGRAPIYRSTEYTANPGTIQYPMTAYGIYHIYGYVTRAGIVGSEGSYDDGIIKTVNIKRSQTIPSTTTLIANENLSNPISTGTNIRFTSTATIGGIGATPVQYSFWRYDARGYALVKDWSSQNYLDWTPNRVGVYTIEVRAKGQDAGSYEASRSVTVTVIGDKQIAQGVSITLLNQADLIANAQAKKPITIKASATSTNSTDLLYKFYTYDANMLIIQLQGYSVNQNCVWVPRKAGDYKIMVLVKNMSSFGQFDAIQSYDITVN